MMMSRVPPALEVELTVYELAVVMRNLLNQALLRQFPNRYTCQRTVDLHSVDQDRPVRMLLSVLLHKLADIAAYCEIILYVGTS